MSAHVKETIPVHFRWQWLLQLPAGAQKPVSRPAALTSEG